VTSKRDAGVARARGLATRLVSRERVHELARLPGTGALLHDLVALGYPVGAPTEPLESPEAAIDAALSRGELRRLGILSRWVESWPELAAVLLLEHERRTLRAVLRGAACRDLRERIGVLARRQHPCAVALAAAYRRRGADPMALDLAASRALVERARRATRSADSRLRAWVAEEVDLENAWTLLLLGGGSGPAAAREAFLEGGARLIEQRFEKLARERDEAQRRAGLAKAFSGSPLARAFDDPTVPSSALEMRVLGERLAAQRRAARVDPLSSAPILAFSLALRAEVADLRRIHWGIVQGLSPDAIERELVAMS
jgi:hypothetical protein